MADLWFDAFSAMDRGNRDEQQDAVVSDVIGDGNTGYLALADGCGGHAGGSRASQIAITKSIETLSQLRDQKGLLPGKVSTCLTTAVEAANDAIAAEAAATVELADMSTTLLLVVVQERKLYWASVGDSPLFLLRNREIRRLNQTHSFAAYLDLLVNVGEISPEEARHHPGRHLLTSALGSDTIEKLDCPDVPFSLRDGDVILAASDGLLTLEPHEVRNAADAARGGDAEDIANRLIERVVSMESEEQDNVAVGVLSAASSPRRLTFRSLRPMRSRRRKSGLRALSP